MQGKTINGYTLQRQLGVGGMAEVWLADNAIGKKAAVKLLLPKFCNDEAIVARFENEAKVMVQLDHPNIRQVYDYANIDGRPCIVMEYLEGDDLKALMKSGKRFTEEELRKWWNQIADALNYTHAKGIVHRDIKPSNLFLDKKGNIKLLDFGIAKIKESISMTQTGAMMGTLLYMSPEQVEDSKHIGPQSDIYSLAVTFVHLLTGKAPYDITTSSDYAIRKGIVEIPLDLTAVPADWRGFLAPYLAKKPENRPTLKPFEAVACTPPASIPDDNDATISDNAGSGTTASTFKGTGGIKTTHPTSTDKPKSKKGLWIALGAVAAVAVLLVLLLKSKKEDPLATDPDTQAYGACQTVADYRAYMNGFGLNALHYSEAKQFVDNYIADSTAQAQQVLAEAQAQQQAEAEAQAQAQADAEEERNWRGISSGVFSVSASKKVRFAKGNLQYQVSTNKWRFASKPWDIVGEGNKICDENRNILNYNSWIDLFSWGTGSNTMKQFGYDCDLSQFNDWGNNSISNGGREKWRTLTKNEWDYVFFKRNTSSGIRFAKAKVNGVCGVILLPDDWLESNYALKSCNHSRTSYINTISASQWSVFEQNGAVFLPAAGETIGWWGISFAGEWGHYWSSSYVDNDCAFSMGFNDCDLWVGGGAGLRFKGFSVRLVCPVK